MSIRRDGALLRLEDDCPVEEAETLVALLQSGGVEAADLSACRHVHSAVAQALIAFRVPVRSGAAEPFVRDLLIPALQAGTRHGPAEAIEDLEMTGRPGAPEDGVEGWP